VVLQYDSLRAFTDDLNATAKPFPLKVMGQSRPGVSYTATMLAAVCQDTQDPDVAKPPIVTNFGTINRRGAVLAGGKNTYSEHIIAASDGSNTFQGDIFQTRLDLAPWGCRVLCEYGIIVSHSCDIGPATTVNICPAFPEHEVDQTLMEFIKGKPSPNYKIELQDMLRNQQHRLLGLPAHGQDNSPLPDEPLLVFLSLMMPVTKDKVGPTVLRLTYRANAYFQMRLGTLLMRDVQRSDETREF
jgi:hypothetical protein